VVLCEERGWFCVKSVGGYISYFQYNMTFSYPILYLLPALLLGALYAGLLYGKEKKETGSESRNWLSRPGLALLRFVAVSAIAILLLDPVLKYRQNETEKPLLLVAIDNSASLKLGPDSALAAATATELEALQQVLGDEFDVRSFRFGTDLTETLPESGPASFDEPATDLSAALTALDDRFANRNVGAIVLASDGIYNLGNNPAYGSRRLGAPIYTIGLGDTTRRRDLRIDRNYVNRLVYLNDRFTLRLDLSAIHATGEMATLRLAAVEQSGERLLDSRTVALNGDPFAGSEEFIVSADRPGVLHLRVRFGPLEGESTIANNTVDLFIDVLDGRQRMLLLAHAPHPDLAALRQVMEAQGNYEVRLVMARDFDGSLEAADLVVLHQLPSSNYPLSSLLAVMKAEKIPALYVLGAQSDLELFNRSQDLIRIRAGNGSMNEVQAQMDPAFSLFAIDEPLRNALRQFPPLMAPFGDYRTSPTTKVALTQRIGSVNTEYPLLAFGEVQGVRTGVLAAEGLYRWRLFDFLDAGNHERFEALTGKSLQYLAVKSDRRNFRTLLAKNLFTEKENIAFQAELYNDSYEPVNTPDVELAITDADGKRYEYRFNRQGQGYALQAGSLPPGSYAYRARTSWNSKEYTSEGQFTVAPLQLEALNVTANHGLLAGLSEASGGAFFSAGQRAALVDSLRANNAIRPLLHESLQTRSVINLRLLFFLFLALLSVEWFVRKIQGGY